MKTIKLLNLINDIEKSGIDTYNLTSLVRKAEKKVLPTEDLLVLLGYLKACLNLVQSSHWVSKGESQYGDHLLFERIYNGLIEQIDLYAEKIIGNFGEGLVDPIKTLAIAAKVLNEHIEFSTIDKGKELATKVLTIEEETANKITEVYEKLKEKDELTLGMDDLLMSMHSEHESFIYLLKQRLKGDA